MYDIFFSLFINIHASGSPGMNVYLLGLTLATYRTGEDESIYYKDVETLSWNE